MKVACFYTHHTWFGYGRRMRKASVHFEEMDVVGLQSVKHPNTILRHFDAHRRYRHDRTLRLMLLSHHAIRHYSAKHLLGEPRYGFQTCCIRKVWFINVNIPGRGTDQMRRMWAYQIMENVPDGAPVVVMGCTNKLPIHEVAESISRSDAGYTVLKRIDANGNSRLMTVRKKTRMSDMRCWTADEIIGRGVTVENSRILSMINLSTHDAVCAKVERTGRDHGSAAFNSVEFTGL